MVVCSFIAGGGDRILKLSDHVDISRDQLRYSVFDLIHNLHCSKTAALLQQLDHLLSPGNCQFCVIPDNLCTFSVVPLFQNLAFVIGILIFGITIVVSFI